MARIDPNDVPESIPRVVVTDGGAFWKWRDHRGRQHLRDKAASSLPAVINEIHHARNWIVYDEDSIRTILLLPPTE